MGGLARAARAVRYYPPGIILLYEQGGHQYQRTLDLLDLQPGTNVEALVDQIMQSEPLLTPNRRRHIVQLIHKLIDKQKQEKTHEFGLLRVSEMERMSVLPWSGLRFRFSLLGNQPSNI